MPTRPPKVLYIMGWGRSGSTLLDRVLGQVPGVVSLASPASRYLVALGQAVALLRPGASVTLVAAAGRFPRYAREGRHYA